MAGGECSMYRRQLGTYNIHTSYSIPHLNALNIYLLCSSQTLSAYCQLLQLVLTGVHVSVEAWRTVLRPDADRDLHSVQYFVPSPKLQYIDIVHRVDINCSVWY